MNWRRGLFRLWLVVSLLWVGSVTWVIYDHERDRAYRDALDKACMEDKKLQGASPFDCFDSPAAMFANLPRTTSWLLKHYATWALLPPLVTLALGIAGRWILVGFRRPE